MRQIIYFLPLFLVSLLLNCATFVPADDEMKIADLENYTYIMLQDVVHDRFSLKKGNSVKIVVNVGDSWIKVYGYSIEKDYLQSDRVLLLFLFNDDFPDEKFDRKFFEKKLFSLIRKK